MKITSILTLHREGRLAVPSLKSFVRSVKYAQNGNISVEAICMLDNADELTRNLAEQFKAEFLNDLYLFETSFADQGLVRNEAVKLSNGEFIAFLDGDDLWTSAWLMDAYHFLQSTDYHKVVAHPEFNYFFENYSSIFRHIDQTSEEFILDALRVVNHWDALGMAHRTHYESAPYCKRDVSRGWAFEDWHWNIKMIEAGVTHRVVPNTVIFKRRQRDSQTIKASTSKARVRTSSFLSYNSDLY